MDLQSELRKTYDYLKTKKLDAFELYCSQEDNLLIDSKEGTVNSLDQSSEIGLAVRVISENRMGFAYTTSFEDSALKKCIETAILSSQQVEPDDAFDFAESVDVKTFDWKVYDEAFISAPIDEKISRAVNLEKAALSTDPRVKRVRRASYEETVSNIYLLNSKGLELAFKSTLCGCQITAVTESDGDSQWATDFNFSHNYSSFDVESVGKNAANEALSLLGAKSIGTTKIPIVIQNVNVALMLNVLCRSFFADNIYKKKSILVGKLGENNYSSKLNIINDGLLKGGLASQPFDGEGTPSKKVHLVKDGKIESWLSDSYWGKKLGIASTSSSVRNSFSELPIIGASNAYIEKGEKTKEAILRHMGTGLYITDLVGLHTANPVTGDFSLGASGQWVENGEMKYPVKGVMIAGNLHNLFKNVSELANDLRFEGNIGAPSILFSEVQVSGE